MLDALNELLGPHVFPARDDGGDPRICPTCGTGQLSLKLGKFGAFVGCSNYPECRYTRQLGDRRRERQWRASVGGDGTRCSATIPRPARGHAAHRPLRPLCPARRGGEGEAEARRACPRAGTPATIDLEKALALLALPREVGMHPETGKPISAGLGRYGPFVLHDGTYANLESVEEVFSVGLNRAVSRASPRSRPAAAAAAAAATPAALKDARRASATAAPITVRDGRYGPYVNHGKVNATLPKGMDPTSVTLERRWR